jgi:hypothetical protein
MAPPSQPKASSSATLPRAPGTPRPIQRKGAPEKEGRGSTEAKLASRTFPALSVSIDNWIWVAEEKLSWRQAKIVDKNGPTLLLRVPIMEEKNDYNSRNVIGWEEIEAEHGYFPVYFCNSYEIESLVEKDERSGIANSQSDFRVDGIGRAAAGIVAAVAASMGPK